MRERTGFTGRRTILSIFLCFSLGSRRLGNSGSLEDSLDSILLPIFQRAILVYPEERCQLRVSHALGSSEANEIGAENTVSMEYRCRRA